MDPFFDPTGAPFYKVLLHDACAFYLLNKYSGHLPSAKLGHVQTTPFFGKVKSVPWTLRKILGGQTPLVFGLGFVFGPSFFQRNVLWLPTACCAFLLVGPMGRCNQVIRHYRANEWVLRWAGSVVA